MTLKTFRGLLITVIALSMVVNMCKVALENMRPGEGVLNELSGYSLFYEASDNDFDTVFDVYEYLVNTLEIEEANWFWRGYEDLFGSESTFLRRGKANCKVAANLLKNTCQRISKFNGEVELVYIDRNNKVSSDWKRSKHCAVLFNGSYVFDVSMASGYVELGMFESIDDWLSEYMILEEEMMSL